MFTIAQLFLNSPAVSTEDHNVYNSTVFLNSPVVSTEDDYVYNSSFSQLLVLSTNDHLSLFSTWHQRLKSKGQGFHWNKEEISQLLMQIQASR